jgi:hypothetical protein
MYKVAEYTQRFNNPVMEFFIVETNTEEICYCLNKTIAEKVADALNRTDSII